MTSSSTSGPTKVWYCFAFNTHTAQAAPHLYPQQSFGTVSHCIITLQLSFHLSPLPPGCTPEGRPWLKAHTDVVDRIWIVSCYLMNDENKNKQNTGCFFLQWPPVSCNKSVGREIFFLVIILSVLAGLTFMSYYPWSYICPAAVLEIHQRCWWMT